MMRRRTFAGSLVFAAVAGAGLVPAVLLLTPWLGAQTGLALYLIAVTALYVRGLMPEGRRRPVAVAATLVVGLTAAACLRSVGEMVLVMAVVAAVARSGVAFRLRTGRALLIETVLVGGGLLFARTVGGTTLAGWALGLWAFLLVQSVYVLLGGASARSRAEAEEDAFAAAYDRALALLEGREV